MHHKTAIHNNTHLSEHCLTNCTWLTHTGAFKVSPQVVLHRPICVFTLLQLLLGWVNTLVAGAPRNNWWNRKDTRVALAFMADLQASALYSSMPPIATGPEISSRKSFTRPSSSMCFLRDSKIGGKGGCASATAAGCLPGTLLFGAAGALGAALLAGIMRRSTVFRALVEQSLDVKWNQGSVALRSCQSPFHIICRWHVHKSISNLAVTRLNISGQMLVAWRDRGHPKESAKSLHGLRLKIAKQKWRTPRRLQFFGWARRRQSSSSVVPSCGVPWLHMLRGSVIVTAAKNANWMDCFFSGNEASVPSHMSSPSPWRWQRDMTSRCSSLGKCLSVIYTLNLHDGANSCQMV